MIQGALVGFGYVHCREDTQCVAVQTLDLKLLRDARASENNRHIDAGNLWSVQEASSWKRRCVLAPHRMLGFSVSNDSYAHLRRYGAAKQDHFATQKKSYSL